MGEITHQGLEHWKQRRSQLRRRWWIYLFVAMIGTALFIRNFQSRDPLTFAILLLIPLLALRQMWQMDRLIADCDNRLRAPIITDTKEKP